MANKLRSSKENKVGDSFRNSTHKSDSDFTVEKQRLERATCSEGCSHPPYLPHIKMEVVKRPSATSAGSHAICTNTLFLTALRREHAQFPCVALTHKK